MIQLHEPHTQACGPWASDATVIGMNPASVTALDLLTTQARAALNAEAARQAAKSAAQNFHDKVRAMHRGPSPGQDQIDTIRRHAWTKNDSNLYTLAQVAPPAVPGTFPPARSPSDFAVVLPQNGELQFK